MRAQTFLDISWNYSMAWYPAHKILRYKCFGCYEITKSENRQVIIDNSNAVDECGQSEQIFDSKLSTSSLMAMYTTTSL